MIYYILNILDWAHAFIKDSDTAPYIHDFTINYLQERAKHSIFYKRKMDGSL